MKFDYAIGNPPYQAEISESSGNKTYSAPVYNFFLDEAFKVADKVEMIHPARFLFNAGSTPKAWNKKMLSDPHFKVMYYVSDSSSVFPATDIMGGVAISYHDKDENFGAIEVFVANPVLRSILNKVHVSNAIGLSSIAISGYAYHFTQKLHDEHPEAKKLLSTGHAYDLKSNVFEKLPMIFHDVKPNDGQDYAHIFGRVKDGRATKYILQKYIAPANNYWKYKIFVPSANGAKELGATGTMIEGKPQDGSTETFMSIGGFETEVEAKSALKYMSGKFARALFGILKITQHITPETWKYVPLQDFTSNSDINWSASIHDIDQQLYKKYGLSQQEIDFIESHVKEMA